MTQTILIVDDEQDIASVLEYRLRSEGFRVLVAKDGQSGLKLATSDPLPDLVLLDLMLPDLSGVEICRRLRADPKTARMPVVMLTAKDQEIDRVIGFELGADDYLVKPFSLRELVLRLKAVLRRVTPAQAQGEEHTFGVLRLDLQGHRVFVQDLEVELTALEFRLLSTLFARKGRVQTREMLLTDVWGMRAGITTRTVDTHMQRLRKKLGVLAGDYIETLRGVGYRFRDELA